MAYADVLQAGPELAGDAWTAASDLAYHSYAGLDLARALPAAIEAARQSASAFAYAEAQRHLIRALEIWPRVPDAAPRSGLDHLALLERAVDASMPAGEWETAASLVDAALAEVDAGADPERAALLLERRAVIRQELGGGDPMGDLRAAADLLPEDRPSRARVQVLNSLGILFMHRGDVLLAADLAEQAVRAAQAVSATDLEVWALPTMALRGYDGNLDEVLPLLNHAVALGSSIGAHDAVLRAHTILSDLYEAFGRHEQAARDAAAGVELARAVGLSRAWGGVLLLNEAAPLLRLGRWDDAERLVGEALELDLSPLWRAAALATAADILVGRGRLEEAAAHVAAAKDLLGGRVEPQIAMLLALVAAQVATAARDWAGARAIVANALSDADLGDLRRGDMRRYAWPLLWWGLRIEADAVQGMRDQGLHGPVDRAPREKLQALAGDLPADSPVFRGYRALSLAEVARSEDTATIDAWSKCVAAWRTAAEPHPLAYALVRSGEAALSVGDRQVAATAIAEASSIAATLGAAPLLAEAAALSRRGRLGEPTSAADAAQQTASTLGLTSREVDVLRLLAAGRTNTQIGAELFISPKTVSVHVSNILAKLGVAGRVQAAGVAHRLGLTTAR